MLRRNPNEKNARVNRKYKIKPGNFIIKEFNGPKLKSVKIDEMVRTIYKNFFYLSHYPELKHSISEINRLFRSSKMIAFFIYNGYRIIGYVIGEIMRLNDGRLVLYLSYLYIAKKYRRHGFGSALLKQITHKAHRLKMDNVLLTCDTENKSILDFYLQKGFMYDPYLRKYSRYDVLSLPLN